MVDGFYRAWSALASGAVNPVTTVLMPELPSTLPGSIATFTDKVRFYCLIAKIFKFYSFLKMSI